MEFFTQIQYISIHLSWSIVVVGEGWVHGLLGAPKQLLFMGRLRSVGDLKKVCRWSNDSL